MKRISIHRSRQYSLRFLGCFVIVIMSSFLACAKTALVYVEPRFDLTEYVRVGIIDCTTNAEPAISRYATQQLEEYIHSAQAGIHFIELGAHEDMLKAVQSNKLDSKALQRLGDIYNVDAILQSDLEYSDVKADVNMKDIVNLKTKVQTYLYATLTAQLNETSTGANIWSSSSSFKRTLGKFNYSRDGSASFGMGGYHDAYRKLIPDMVYAVTQDFRGKYVKERIN